MPKPKLHVSTLIITLYNSNIKSHNICGKTLGYIRHAVERTNVLWHVLDRLKTPCVRLNYSLFHFYLMKYQILTFLNGSQAIRKKFEAPTQEDVQRLGMEDRFIPLQNLVRHYYVGYYFTKVSIRCYISQ